MLVFWDPYLVLRHTCSRRGVPEEYSGWDVTSIDDALLIEVSLCWGARGRKWPQPAPLPMEKEFNLLLSGSPSRRANNFPCAF